MRTPIFGHFGLSIGQHSSIYLNGHSHTQISLKVALSKLRAFMNSSLEALCLTTTELMIVEKSNLRYDIRVFNLSGVLMSWTIRVKGEYAPYLYSRIHRLGGTLSSNQPPIRNVFIKHVCNASILAPVLWNSHKSSHFFPRFNQNVNLILHPKIYQHPRKPHLGR